MVGVSLLHRKGYFRQRLDSHGNQSEQPCEWKPDARLEPLDARVSVSLGDRRVWLRAWRFALRGIEGHVVPVYLLDTSLDDNGLWERTLTDHLYGGDAAYRLCQEAILGIGGVAMLGALGYQRIARYHMNEGHSTMLALALLDEALAHSACDAPDKAHIDAVRRRCVFTTHTPVPAGHDKFAMEQVESILGAERAAVIESIGCCIGRTLNMTYLGLFFSAYINGVSMRHEAISRGMFPLYRINAITNGVHAVTWTSPAFCELFDAHVPEWRRDNRYLRYAVSIPTEEIRHAHERAKQALIEEVRARTGVALDAGSLLIGFARRATPYKRADLLLSDLERLERLARDAGPLQILYAGKAHPLDDGGKEVIRRIYTAAASLADSGVRLLYLEEYDMALAKNLCAGVDLWLNTPQKPLEASGTSGMKAACNGVPSLSVLDGWWIEGHVEGVTGWSIGEDWQVEADPRIEANALYDKLEHVILPLYYRCPDDYAKIMRSAIALNASFFNAQRMVSQYLENAYPAPEDS
jgi:starch phosphorylase